MSWVQRFTIVFCVGIPRTLLQRIRVGIVTSLHLKGSPTVAGRADDRLAGAV